ncbi:MAG: methylmalonyl-CoA mutase small subunit [Bacteroidales bacterium]|nr:methylmalonyl-CoA mutase small subunit [Bacteroidales bacterium]
MMKEEQKLFEDFQPVPTAAWIERITRDLKGADYSKKMIWKTNEGFEVQPFYRSENLEGLTHLSSMPGEFPYVRGTKTTGNSWFVRQNIEIGDYTTANKKALDILMRGVDSLGFIIENADTLSQRNIEVLLGGIYPESIELCFSTTGKARELVQYLISAFRTRGSDLASIRGAVEADPLGRLMVNGKLCVSVEEGLDYLAGLVRDSEPMPSMRVINVNAANFNNAGADIVRELAFGLALGNEYMAQLTERGIDASLASSKMGFTFGIGSNYFMEIAKLRAARMLWATIVKGYGSASPASGKMNILAVTSEWNKTVYDPYVNMLRTQTEAMSAALGGTDTLLVNPFNHTFSKPDDFAERIARNQQLLLREEAHFDKVADPAAGSWYIENLTAMVADAAWKLFLEVEKKGGFLAALMQGFIQASVEEIASKRRGDIEKRREVFLGSNQYPNTKEIMSATIDMKKAFPGKPETENSVVKPLRLFRGAEEFEKLRVTAEKSSRRPSVFILAAGNPAMRLARSQFTANFFGCGGYQIIDNGGYKTVAEGVKAAVSAAATIVVLCSSDEEYATLAPEAFELLGGRSIFVVAGAPECMEELKAKGITRFISIRSNVLETLRQFHSEIGITI